LLWPSDRFLFCKPESGDGDSCDSRRPSFVQHAPATMARRVCHDGMRGPATNGSLRLTKRFLEVVHTLLRIPGGKQGPRLLHSGWVGDRHDGSELARVGSCSETGSSSEGRSWRHSCCTEREEPPVSDQVPLSDLDRRAHGGEGDAQTTTPGSVGNTPQLVQAVGGDVFNRGAPPQQAGPPTEQVGNARARAATGGGRRRGARTTAVRAEDQLAATGFMGPAALRGRPPRESRSRGWQCG